MTSRQDPSGRSKTLSGLDDILKGEAISFPLPAVVDASDADKMLEQGRRRFDRLGLWTISAAQVTGITPRGRDRIRHAFTAFQDAGGETLIIWCADPSIAEIFKAIAKGTRLSLKIVRTDAEFRATAKSVREDRDRRLRETRDSS